MYLYSCRRVEISRCLFILNCAKWGGGIYIEKSEEILVRKNVFIGNFALRDGGAISVSHSSDVTLECNRMLANFARRQFPACDVHKSQRVVLRH